MKQKSISFIQLIFLTMAFFASVRRIPNIAFAGWQAIPFMLFALLMFVLPVSFVSAQLATAMPSDGGLTVWLGRTLSPKWGFVASFLVWAQMCFGMVTVGAAFAAMLATITGNEALLQNNAFIGITVIVLFWLITLLIIAGAPLTAISTVGMILGLVVPLALLLVLGSVYAVQEGSFSAPTVNQLLPGSGGFATLANLSGIIFLFAGMEQASNYANRIQNPRKNYPKALLLATLLTAALFTFAGLLTNAILPAGSIQLADPAQVFGLIANHYGVPWLTTAVAAMIGLSCITELAAWISGPSRNLLQSAKGGILPPVFAKTNRHDIPVALLLVQAGVVSAIALVFVFIPGTNGVFEAILTMAVALYAVVYILILIAGVRYRKTAPANAGAYQIPGGKWGAHIFTALGFVGMGIVIFAALIPPSTLGSGNPTAYSLLIASGVLVFTAIPLAIYRWRRNRVKQTAKAIPFCLLQK